MAVFKIKNSPYYHFDFQIDGHRFYGSTKQRTRREAEAIERVEREKAKRHVAQLRAAATSLRLDDVAGRYWSEVGQHHSGARNTERQIGYLIEFFGKDTLITNIADADVAKLVAWRRGHRNANGALLSAFTVNDCPEQLKKIFTRAKMWGVVFDREPQWRRHFLPEPEERVRELVGDEGERLMAAARDDYAPFFQFASLSGFRLHECLLRWSEVDWGARQIRKRGKGNQLISIPITMTIRELLWPLQGHHPEFVFTYVAARTSDSRIEGERYPLTYDGVRAQWSRLRKRAGVSDFRFHDFRHDVGSKILRATGNLKLAQKALNHRNIKSTLRYAHVLDGEVVEAFERVQKPQTNHRNLPPAQNLKGKTAC
jgi:integrase